MVAIGVSPVVLCVLVPPLEKSPLAEAAVNVSHARNEVLRVVSPYLKPTSALQIEGAAWLETGSFILPLPLVRRAENGSKTEAQ